MVLYDEWLRGKQLDEDPCQDPGLEDGWADSWHEATKVNWLLARYAPRSSLVAQFAEPYVVDARLPAAEQLAGFKHLGWPEPPSAGALVRCMVAYVAEQCRSDPRPSKAMSLKDMIKDWQKGVDDFGHCDPTDEIDRDCLAYLHGDDFLEPIFESDPDDMAG